MCKAKSITYKIRAGVAMWDSKCSVRHIGADRFSILTMPNTDYKHNTDYT